MTEQFLDLVVWLEILVRIMKVSAMSIIWLANTGLVIKAQPPAAVAVEPESTSSWLLTKITGVLWFRVVWWIFEQVVNPSIPGIMTSRKMRSKGFSAARANAASPLSA